MITNDDLELLRCEVRKRLSEKRYVHTIGVEECAYELGEMMLASEQIPSLRAAALLHDITKEFTVREHLALLEEAGEDTTSAARRASALLHAETAVCVIRRDFPKFATDPILTAVKRHTVGAQDMSVFDKIIFLADYIEPNRMYNSCVAVRDYVYTSLSEGGDDPMRILDEAVLRELNFTMTALLRKDAYLSEETLRARNAILARLNKG